MKYKRYIMPLNELIYKRRNPRIEKGLRLISSIDTIMREKRR
jgi:hypothetical protein